MIMKLWILDVTEKQVMFKIMILETSYVTEPNESRNG